MTTSKGYLLVPRKITTIPSFAFIQQVILAASYNPKFTLTILCEGEESPIWTLASDGATLPLLLIMEGSAASLILNQGIASINKILGESLSVTESLEALNMVDLYGQFIEKASNSASINDDELLQLLKTKANHNGFTILICGWVRVLLAIGGQVSALAKQFYDSFVESLPCPLAALDTNSYAGPFFSGRRIKSGVAFEYDWDVKRLPQKETRNILITSALPYVNNVPHLGNIIGAVLSADVFARYCRLRGYQTIYIGGTDEYGTATETKALEENISCAELCAKYYKLHSTIYDWFDIQTDIFGRSSTPQQTEITHEIFQDLFNNGYFFEQSVEQSFCEGCNRFLADRYVEGTCPHCSYNDARGDQCDACGKLLNPIELKDARCKLCRRTPVIRSSKHLFLDLTKLQPVVEDFVERQSRTGNWSANSTSIAKGWLTDGLKPRCMTRDLKWGTPVPVPGFEDKVFYVWFDAPIGYISITANYTKEWRQWWKAGKNITCGKENENENEAKPKVELFQFMGKDNVPFHTVIFPSTLLGTVSASEQKSSQDCPWTLLHHINTTEYLNYENGKFSKSRGIGVFGNDARDSGIPVSVWRYYLLAVRPETTDSTFSWDDFGARNNNELLANLGNFISRVSKFAVTYFEGRVPGITRCDEAEEKLVAAVNEELIEYERLMEGVHLRAALKVAMSISSRGNAYLTETGLDKKLLQANRDRCGTIITVALNLAHLLSAILEPFIPATSHDIRLVLNAPGRQIPQTFDLDILQADHQLGTPFHLFSRLEEKRLAELRAKFAGKQSK